MNSRRLFEYLTEKITEGISEEFAGWSIKGRKGCELKYYGLRHTKPFPTNTSTLLSLLRNVICYGKEHLFQAGGDSQTIYAYNGHYFEPIEGKGEKFLKEIIKRVFMGLSIGIVYQTDIAGMIARECLDTLTSTDEYLYTPNKRYIAFSNGVLDIDKGELKNFNIKYRPFIAIDVEYGTEKELHALYADKFGVDREKHPGKLWEWKIREIIPNDDMRDAFQMFCGSLLLDRQVCKFEYCCYLIGSGSNGKSVLASAIAGVFGEQYFSRFTPKQLFKDSDARVNIAALEGKICNLVGDLDATDFAGGDFKRFASGEKFQGRRNYKDPIQVVAPPLLCCTNTMPETSDDSWGHHRRQLPIYTTTHRFTEEDKDPYLSQKLTTPEARSYIFTWMYDGYKKIMRNGGNIKLGEDVMQAMRDLQDNSSSARRWYRDFGYVAIKNPYKKDIHWRPLSELYAEYENYAKECGYTAIMKSHEVANMLRSKEVASVRRTKGLWFCLKTEYNEVDNNQD